MTFLQELGKIPIPGDTPQGRDPKYEPAYGVLQDEIRKLGSMSGGSVDWPVVVNAAKDVLTTLAKDIPAAVYLTVGLGQTEGLVGWAHGTQVCADVLAEYWETAFPPVTRLRARSNSLDWWKERSMALLDGWKNNPPCSWQDFALAQEAVAALDDQLAEHFPDQPPLHDVREALRRVPAQSPPAAEPEASTSSSADPGAAAMSVDSAAALGTAISATSATSGIPATPAFMPGTRTVQPVVVLSDAYGVFHSLAGEVLNFLCGPEPTPDPLAWKIVYASLLGKIVTLPSVEGVSTAIPAPDAATLAACRSHLEAGNSLAAVGAAVAFAPACPLWLDVQRCVAEGLAASGTVFAGALSVVRHECAGLLDRLPELIELTFADGVPLADLATRTWLMSLNSGEGGQTRQTAEELLAEAAMAKAGALAGQQNVSGALDALEDAARTVSGKDGATCLRLRVQQVRVLCRNARFALAVDLADEVSAVVDRHGLELWNPELALEVRQAVYVACAGLEGGEGPRSREAFRHVARLSPAAALRLEGS